MISIFRVGLGQDSHRFEEEGSKKPLVLGGIEFQGEIGLKANSDGDVVLHALFNALSQAVGGKSIGIYADPLCLEQGIKDSKKLLKPAIDMIEKKGYVVNNVGIMIECKKPKIEPHSEEMKESISKLLNIEKDRVGITATTGEGLTSFGKGEGIQVFAIASLVKGND